MLYVGTGGAADRHAHHSVQLVWAREGRVALALDGGDVRVRAGLIAGSAPHGFDATGRWIALWQVEPHGARGAALDRRAAQSPGADLAAALAGVPAPAEGMTAAAAARWCDQVATALGAEPAPPLSSVTRRAVAYIEGSLDGTPRLDEAAGRLGISGTRLTHLFTREVGIPFRRFVLWARIKRAVEASRAGATLTAAAAAAGFSDAAHLSRTFRAMFGLSPASFLPRVELIGAP